MTDADKPSSADGAQAEPVQADPVLQLLVAAANDSAVGEFPITLTTSGGIITGTLVSRKEWFEGAAAWADSMNEGAGGMARMIGQLIEDSQRERARNEGDTDQEFADPANTVHIHLKDACLMSGGSVIPTHGGMFWRGRLSEVSGWSQGSLAVR